MIPLWCWLGSAGCPFLCLQNRLAQMGFTIVVVRGVLPVTAIVPVLSAGAYRHYTGTTTAVLQSTQREHCTMFACHWVAPYCVLQGVWRSSWYVGRNVMPCRRARVSWLSGRCSLESSRAAEGCVLVHDDPLLVPPAVDGLFFVGFFRSHDLGVDFFYFYKKKLHSYNKGQQKRFHPDDTEKPLDH